MKLVRLIKANSDAGELPKINHTTNKMRLNETYRRAQLGKNFSDMFPIKNDLS
jgi:hypothetical protein